MYKVEVIFSVSERDLNCPASILMVIGCLVLITHNVIKNKLFYSVFMALFITLLSRWRQINCSLGVEKKSGKGSLNFFWYLY